jgi:hypothetical protein
MLVTMSSASRVRLQQMRQTTGIRKCIKEMHQNKRNGQAHPTSFAGMDAWCSIRGAQHSATGNIDNQ